MNQDDIQREVVIARGLALEDMRQFPWYQEYLQREVLTRMSELRGPGHIYAMPPGEVVTPQTRVDSRVDAVSGQDHGVGDGTAATRRGRRGPRPPRPTQPGVGDTAGVGGSVTITAGVGGAFIPSIWSDAVLDSALFGNSVVSHITQQTQLPTMTGHVAEPMSGFAMQQLAMQAEHVMRPVIRGVERHVAGLERQVAHQMCVTTCQEGPVPIMCDQCCGVAFYLDRLHQSLCRFDASQVRRLDGSTPATTDQPRCGTCGHRVTPPTIAGQLNTYRQLQTYTTDLNYYEHTPTLLHAHENGIAPIFPEVRVEFRRVTKLIDARRRDRTADDLPALVAHVQRWVDRWGRRNHWLTSSARIAYDNAADTVVVVFFACRPPAQYVGQFTRDRIDAAVRDNAPYVNLPILTGQRVVMPLPRELAHA